MAVKKKAKRKARAKVKVGAKSRATNKRPSAELKRRRAKNTKKGYYPNPLVDIDKAYIVAIVDKHDKNEKGFWTGKHWDDVRKKAAIYPDKKTALSVAKNIPDAYIPPPDYVMFVDKVTGKK